MDDGFISISAAAVAVGVNKSTLARQVKAGLIRSQNGKVKLSQVLEDRASNINASIWEHRQKSGGSPAIAPSLHATGEVTAEPLHATVTTDDEKVSEDDDGIVVVDGKALPISVAKALKETYLARLAKLKFEVESGTLVEADVVHKAVFERFRQVRDSWTNWVAQNAPMISAELGVEQVKFAVVMEKYVRRQLTELSQAEIRITG